MGIISFSSNSIHMKTISAIFSMLLIAVVVGNSTNANTQKTRVTQVSSTTSSVNFGRFNAHRQQKGIGLSWNMVANERIQGFVIERSYDGEWFEEVGQTGFQNSNHYRFTDGSVYPGYLYYRVVAIMDNGTEDVSTTEVVRIVSRK